MEKSTLQDLIRALISESINFNKHSRRVYFGKKEYQTDVKLVNEPGKLHKKEIDTFKTLTLNDTKVAMKAIVSDQPADPSFTKQRQIDISTSQSQKTGRIFIESFNLYNDLDVKNKGRPNPDSNIPSSSNGKHLKMLEYGKIAKNQYDTSNTNFTYDKTNITIQAAKDFVNNSMITNLIKDFKPEIIISPDSSSALNEEILKLVVQQAPNAQVFKTLKITPTTFFDETFASEDLRLSRAKSHILKKADSHTTQKDRTQAAKKLANQTGTTSPELLQQVNTDMMLKAFRLISDEVSANNVGKTSVKKLKVKIHEVGILGVTQSWRNYIVGLHTTTYSRSSFPVSSFRVSSDMDYRRQGKTINVADLMFESALFFSSVMYLYLTQDLARNYASRFSKLRKARFSQPDDTDDIIKECKKFIKESTSIDDMKVAKLKDYIAELDLAIEAANVALKSPDLEESQRQEVEDQIKTLTDLKEFMQRAQEADNDAAFKLARKKIEKITKNTGVYPEVMERYDLVAEEISNIVMPAYDRLITQAQDYISEQMTLKDLDVLIDLIGDLFENLFEEIEAFAYNLDPDEDSYEAAKGEFDKIIAKAKKEIKSNLGFDAKQSELEIESLNFLSKSPAILPAIFVEILKNVIKGIPKLIISSIMSVKSSGNSTTVDINGIADSIANNMIDFIEEDKEYSADTEYETVKFKKSGTKLEIKIQSDLEDDERTYPHNRVFEEKISIASLSQSGILEINKDLLAKRLLETITESSEFGMFLNKTMPQRLKRILIIDDNIATGATLAGIQRDILEKINKSSNTIAVNFKSRSSSSAKGKMSISDPSNVQAVLDSSDVSEFEGKEDMLSKDLIVTDIVCISPMII